MNSPLDASADDHRSDSNIVLARVLMVVAGLFGGVFVAGLIVGFYAQSNNGLILFAGIAAGSVILLLAVSQGGRLRLALLAQAADLFTFLFAWQDGTGEHNPLSRWAIDASLAALPINARWLAVLLAGLFLILLKVGLAVFLIAVASHLGRYRTIVLTIAITAGLVGAISNLLAMPWSSLVLAAVGSAAPGPR